MTIVAAAADVWLLQVDDGVLQWMQWWSHGSVSHHHKSLTYQMHYSHQWCSHDMHECGVLLIYH